MWCAGIATAVLSTKSEFCLNEQLQSRILREGYVRFPERVAQTYHSNVTRRCFPTPPHHLQLHLDGLPGEIPGFPRLRQSGCAAERPDLPGTGGFPSSKIPNAAAAATRAGWATAPGPPCATCCARLLTRPWKKIPWTLTRCCRSYPAQAKPSCRAGKSPSAMRNRSRVSGWSRWAKGIRRLNCAL